MNKIINSLSIFAGIIAFLIVIAIRLHEVSMDTAPDIMIKATLSFLIISILSKFTFAKIFKIFHEVQKKEIAKKLQAKKNGEQ